MSLERIVGIDAGGTKTRVVEGSAADFDAGSMTCHDFGPGNFRQIGVEGVTDLAAQIVKRFDVAPERARVIGGFAGAGNQLAYAEVTSGFAAAGFARENITITNDASLILAALNNTGIVLIAGTGGICIGRNGGTDIQSDEGLVRAGGYGYRIDSEASGYYLGRRALDVALKIEDGREQEPSMLHDLVRSGLGLASLQDIVPILYPSGDDKASVQARVASLAPLVMEAAARGDKPAKEIVAAVVGDMADHLQAVCLRMGVTKFPVALYGGLFKGPHTEHLILDPLRSHRLLQPFSLELHTTGDTAGDLDVLREAVRFVISNRNK